MRSPKIVATAALATVLLIACDSSSPALPDYLKGPVTCGSTCAEGEICVSACIGYCGNQVPDGGSCPTGCNFYPGHGCYSCSRSCVKVPPACYAPCANPPDPACQAAITGCSQVLLCEKVRQQGCAPY